MLSSPNLRDTYCRSGEHSCLSAIICQISSVLLQRRMLAESKQLEKNSGQEELDLFMKGGLVLDEGGKDDVSVPSSTSLDKKVTSYYR